MSRARMFTLRGSLSLHAENEFCSFLCLTTKGSSSQWRLTGSEFGWTVGLSVRVNKKGIRSKKENLSLDGGGLNWIQT